MERPRQISYVTLKERRGGARLWLEGLRLPDCGFSKGQNYRTELDTENATLTLTVCDTGPNRVSGREKGGKVTPIIDICNAGIAAAFGPVDRVAVRYYAGRIVVSLREVEQRKRRAMRRLADEIESGTLSKGTLCAGGGISDRAIHEGIEQAGLLARSEFLIDIERDYLQMAYDNSPAVNPATSLIVGSVNEVNPRDLPEVSVLQLSLPCIAMSKSGKAKKGNTIPEADKKAGIAFLGALNIIETLMPAVVTGENVTGWMGSVTEIVFNARLEELGYTITGAVLSGGEFGAIEDRARHIWVASLTGETVDLEKLNKPAGPERLADILEPIGPDADCWASMDYLAAKEARDLAAGKGFKRNLVTPENTKIGCLGAGYSKRRQTEAQLKHPSKEGVTRLLTATEHARAKRIPEDHIRGVTSATLAHTVLGNSVIYTLFNSLGFAIAELAKCAVNSAQGVGACLPLEGQSGDLFGFGAV